MRLFGCHMQDALVASGWIGRGLKDEPLVVDCNERLAQIGIEVLVFVTPRPGVKTETNGITPVGARPIQRIVCQLGLSAGASHCQQGKARVTLVAFRDSE